MSQAGGGGPSDPGSPTGPRASRSPRRPLPSGDLPEDPSADDIVAALLGRPRALTRREVATGAGVSLLSARKFWHALGFPFVDHDDAVFTEADLSALRTVASIVRYGDLDEATVLAMTRAFARTADRLASWQVQLVAEAVVTAQTDLGGTDAIDAAAVGWGIDPGLQRDVDPDGEQDEALDSQSGVARARETARSMVDMADELEPLLVYAWRRHLTDTVSRMIQDAEPTTDEMGIQRHVGFADLVSFTSLVRKLTERQLAEVVKRFEMLTADVVTAHGGRVVKTVGDEILYSNRSSAPAAATALDLVDAMADDPVLPDVRVGLASGRVLSRLGDVFGTTVNRAARLTSIAHPGNILVDGPMAQALESVSGFSLTPLRPRTLRGVGRVEPFVLRRGSAATRRTPPAGPAPPSPSVP